MTQRQFLPEDYDLFVLGALEGEELEAFEAHLAEAGEAAKQELARAHARLAGVALLAPESEPPARIKQRLLAEIAPAPPSRRWAPGLAWGAAAAMLLFAVFTEVRSRGIVRHSQEVEQRLAELEEQHEALRTESESYRRILEIVSAPGTLAVSLEAASSPQLHAYWHEDLGLVLAGRNMPGLEPNRTYQLWVIPKQGSPIDAGVFEPDSSGGVTLVTSPGISAADAAAIAITDEPAGGQPQPTTQPIWVGPLG